MEDEAILDLYFARDELAITETERKYGGYCYRIANRILHSHEDSEETVSDTFLQTWNTIPPQRPDFLKLFLARITRNLAFTRWRKLTAAKRGGGETELVLEELGDYDPAYLPEGYEEQGIMGSPLEEGSGWYSYVRKWFVNKAENTQIYFEYETYRIPTEVGYTDNAKTICSFYIPGVENRGEEVKIGGLFGLATENHIAWADPESHVVYHLSSETVTGDELLKVAQSILKNP